MYKSGALKYTHSVVKPSPPLSSRHFYHPKRRLHTHWHSLPIPPHSQPLATTNLWIFYVSMDLPILDIGRPWWFSSKESAANVGDLGSIPGSGRSPGEGNGNPTPVFLPEKSFTERSLAFCSPWRKLSAKELMLLNCGVGEDSWEFLGLQGDPNSPF